MKPGIPFSTIKVEIPCVPESGSVTAVTTKKSEYAPSEIKCFDPFKVQPCFDGVARDVIAAASDPAPGSVNAIENVRSPRTAGRR